MKILFLVIIILVVGVTGGWWIADRMTPSPDTSFDIAQPSGGDFILRSKSGDVNLADYRGKVVLLYFGYTFCPDICPTNLALITQALNEFTDQELERIQTIFVSVDPERDTVNQLANYAAYFHPKIIGVTGSSEQIAEVASRYGAAYQKVEGESRGGYLVDHTSVTTVIGPDGSIQAALPHATPPTEIIKAVRAHL